MALGSIGDEQTECYVGLVQPSCIQRASKQVCKLCMLGLDYNIWAKLRDNQGSCNRWCCSPEYLTVELAVRHLLID